MLLSTLNTMWPIHLQVCYVQPLRRRCIYKKMHYSTFDLRSTQNVAQYPLHHVAYSPARFEVAMSNGYGGIKTLYDLDLGIKVKQNVAQYPPHHKTYAPAKFEVSTSNNLGEDALTQHHVTYAPATFKVATPNRLQEM